MSSRTRFGARLAMIAGLVAVMLAMTAVWAVAAPLLEENFSFTGDLTAIGWTQSGTGTPTIAASSPGLVYPGYAGSDIGNAAGFAAVAGQDVSKSFTSVNSGSVYLVFMLNASSVGSGAYFFEMGQAQAGMQCNFFAKTATGGYKMGIGKAGSGTYATPVYSLNTTYLVVVKYTFVTGASNDEMRLWINPAIGGSEPTADVTTTSGTDGAVSLGYLQIQQYSANQLAGKIDGIRIATTWADAVAPGAPPTIPVEPVATAGTSESSAGFQANWNASSGATSYRLDVSTDSGFGSYVTSYQDLTVSGTSQAVSGLASETAYYYRVRAVNAAGTSGNSNTITVTTSTTPPNAPTLVGPLNGAIDVAVPVTLSVTVSDPDADALTVQFYGRAVPPPPAAPVATAGTNVYSTNFQANWEASSGATSYRLDVATDDGFTSYVAGYQDLAVSGTSRAVSGLTAETPYYYRVRAVGDGGTSGNSNTIMVTTSTTPPVSAEFTVVLIPDTQNYTLPMNGGNIGMFTAQTQWIVNNRVSRNIVAVGGLGDITNDDSPVDYAKADTVYGRLEDPVTTGLPDGIPYVPIMGNHDGSSNFNAVFGVNRYSGRSYYGGHYGSNNDHSYILFSGGGLDFIMVGLSWAPSPAVLTWAHDVIASYPNRRAIVVSHAIVSYGNPGAWDPDGLAIYNALKDLPQLILMGNGHHLTEGRRTDLLNNGNPVTSMCSNYHSRTNDGGNGILRYLEFVPSLNVVRARTYSPYSNVWEADADSSSQFTLTVPLGGTSPSQVAPVSLAALSDFTLLGTVAGVPSGSTASFDWDGHDPLTEYEWYVTVSDDQANPVTGPPWTFTTGTPSAGVEGSAHAGLALAPPAPNPAQGVLRFSFDLPRAMHARLEVLDVQGRLVTALAEGDFGPGRHERGWDASAHGGPAGAGAPAGAGLYFVRLVTPEGRLVRRVALLR